LLVNRIIDAQFNENQNERATKKSRKCKRLAAFRFLGSKRRLIPKLDLVLRSNGIKNCSFGDFFAGSTAVSQYAKSAGFTVKATDILRASYILLRAFIQVNRVPRFFGLQNQIGKLSNGTCYERVLEYLENLPGEEGFIYNNYCPSGRFSESRFFFSDANGKKIDAIREKLADWHYNGKISDLEHDFLLASLLISASQCANTAGSFYAYLRKPDKRIDKQLKLPRLEVVQTILPHEVANMKAEEAVDIFKVDVMYLDPPYNKQQYAAHYHLLETIAWGDCPKLYGKNGIRPYAEKRSAFCSVQTAAKALSVILQKTRARHIILSYGMDGILGEEEIIRMLSSFGEVKIYEFSINSYQNHHTSSNRASERIYYASKNWTQTVGNHWSSPRY